MPSETNNEADIAAVLATVRLYYEGMMAGDEAKLKRAFHSRACIVGSEGGLYWETLEGFAAACKQLVAQAGAYDWRVERLSFTGDTALVALGNRYAGVWYSDDLSLLRIDGAWRIVHKTFYAHPAA